MVDYYNVAEVETACVNLALAYPQITELIVLPNVTAEGRTSRALRLTSGGTAKPVFMVIGGQHGGEWGSCEIALGLAADLLGALAGQGDLVYGPVTYTVAQVQLLFARIDFVFFPLVNPDGRFHSQQIKGDWRKNRNTANAIEGVPESVGVDSNRNFDFLFDHAKGFHASAVISGSDQPVESTYKGPSPESEPETRNVRALVERCARLGCFVDLHSGKQTVIYPWSDDETQTGDEAQRFNEAAHDHLRGLRNDAYGEYMPASDLQAHETLAKVFVGAAARVHGHPYGMTRGYDFAASSGTVHDWVYARHVVSPNPMAPTWSFAVEWSSNPRPSPAKMTQIVGDVSAGLIAMALAAFP
jgi:murein tripeptide amidase MpaA